MPTAFNRFLPLFGARFTTEASDAEHTRPGIFLANFTLADTLFQQEAGTFLRLSVVV